MENNFGLILLDSVRKNKDKYLGLLRRNGVLVNTNISNEDLANMILKAMQKSDSFKKEAILLMGVLISEKKTEGYRLYCKYFSGRNTFYTSYWMTTKLLPKNVDEIRRDYCPFISKP
jgi:hypothetical protein